MEYYNAFCDWIFEPDRWRIILGVSQFIAAIATVFNFIVLTLFKNEVRQIKNDYLFGSRLPNHLSVTKTAREEWAILLVTRAFNRTGAYNSACKLFPTLRAIKNLETGRMKELSEAILNLLEDKGEKLTKAQFTKANMHLTNLDEELKSNKIDRENRLK